MTLEKRIRQEGAYVRSMWIDKDILGGQNGGINLGRQERWSSVVLVTGRCWECASH
jgi:hypothetical protein